MIKKSLQAFAFALAFGSCAAWAQESSPPPTTDQQPAATGQQSAPPTAAGPAQKKALKEIVAGCRSDARAKGLKGPALNSAVIDCVGQQSPELAQRLRCQQQS